MWELVYLVLKEIIFSIISMPLHRFTMIDWKNFLSIHRLLINSNE